MKIIKRSGKEVLFDISKIINAITKANESVEDENERLSTGQIIKIAKNIEDEASNASRAFSVEEIQDKVEKGIVKCNKYYVAREYILYRYKQSEKRSNTELEQKIMAIVNCDNEEIKQENSNKNPTINSTQRDYMAGEISKVIAKKYIYPEDVVKANSLGIIHTHDDDYAAQHMNNCGLVNTDDMLQNGTIISETLIESPHSFSTACNITTQAIAQIASSQYGGQSINLAHVAKFVDVSRQAIISSMKKELAGVDVTEEQFNCILNIRLKQEISKGVQIIQYQIITLMTTNGQAPFISIFMYLNDAETEQEKEDLAMVIEEMLNQRILGVKNNKGQYVTPAFPKLIYVLEEDNITEDSKYWYLTELAAKCSAKRMVPDYISEKKLIELKYPTEKLLHIKDRRDLWGDEKIWGPNVFKNLTDEECNILQDIVDNRFNKDYELSDKAKEIIYKNKIKMGQIVPKAYTCMGCVDGQEIVTYKFCGVLYNESFERFWNRISSIYPVKQQYIDQPHLYIDTDNRLEIYDMKNGFVNVRRLIRNVQNEWVKVKLSNDRQLDCTIDHPLPTNRGRIFAGDLEIGDIIPIDPNWDAKNTDMYAQQVHLSDTKNQYGQVLSLTRYNETKYSYDVTTESDHFNVSGIYSHNCRSFLTPDFIHYKTYGRMNQGVCTINLPYIALLSGGDFDKFWEEFDKYLELCYKALMRRHNYLKGTLSDVAPILWQNGAYGRLEKGETIDKLLFDNYSTISLGYAGLFNCVKYMTGESHTSEIGKPFAIKVMQHLNDKCAEWREKTNIAFSVYGTPIESTTYGFAKALQNRFGKIKDVSDRNYIINSYHVDVKEKIDAFSKLKFESEFQELSPGG